MGKRTAVTVSKARKLKGVLHYCDYKGCKNRSVARIHDIRDNQYHVCSRHKRIMSARFMREAVNKLIRFYNDNSRKRTDAIYDDGGHHYAYIDNLLNISACLYKNDYVTAYAELHDLSFDKSYLQSRVYYPLMSMLYQKLSVQYLHLLSRRKPLRPEAGTNRASDAGYDDQPDVMSRKEMIHEYNYVMHHVSCFLTTEPVKKKEIVKNALANMDTVISLIREDLKYDLYAVAMTGNATARMALIPNRYRDQNGMTQSAQVDSDNDVNIHLNAADSVFYTQTVARPGGSPGAQVDYYRYLDLFHIRNAKTKQRTGGSPGANIIQSRHIYDATRLFPHVRTNGSEWINVHTGKIIADVIDFRVAILYALARNRYFIERCANNRRKMELVLLDIFEQTL
ncbi:hypothetical protein GH808_00460 [Acetobacterium fimetarium]|uniref:Uncharacterized protein n=1 Tax=Acetobacterium fimetarium TaxID=52691 RepID=A0ABR6WQP2_9FIRM|nr:DUF6710 family protein [Acetobacterium fimetarium]MBC3802914.1 hypothetical protein [Acetobacterium fimetarium]